MGISNNYFKKNYSIKTHIRLVSRDDIKNDGMMAGKHSVFSSNQNFSNVSN